MAFTFNWSPILGDTNRVRDMLTDALNKPKKPAIIVDNILVNELNLGSTPPKLEILEIGDLAEDRFRGIFKMSYTGDAYLTLKTKVQVNPLKTYLATKPSFTSPQPLAASSGLTMPVQITLSDIRLSGFVILVFSKQKGITLVFRNDPLESLKVSSTFDSIPFVRDFLQKTIESQLRTLLMEDLPAIIHRLSLQVFNPEYGPVDEELPSKEEFLQQAPIDPFAGPTLDGSDGGEGSPFSLDAPTETYATFSQKNLLRLAALSESQRTLSLFTPSIRDTVYRAWTTAGERGDTTSTITAASTQKLASLSRIHNSLVRQGTWSSTASETSEAASLATRPSLMSMASAPSVYSIGTGRPRAHRKKKHRVVDLRRNKPDDGSETASVSTFDDSKSVSGSRSTAPSITGTQSSRDRASCPVEGELTTPPKTPERRKAASDRGVRTPVRPSLLAPVREDQDPTPRAVASTSEKQPARQALPRTSTLPSMKSTGLSRTLSDYDLGTVEEGSSGNILEQAWMNKITSEVAKRIREEKDTQFWSARSDEGQSGDAPPAYAI
ncbi:hypothetical protein AMS68_000268 [Peltaster fructicola]|uniref:Mitochondrial distribution and morphology protein 34 n=1 Tax=Peltaster fructicola TaxID=286661 RepID=A0A6H0XJD3_9PEZI|nr:hypothetical protein AMS68_000268 [Peltaster fructicola]